MKCNLNLFPFSTSRTTALVQILKKSFVGHFHSPTPVLPLHLRFYRLSYMLSLKRKEHISNLLNDTALKILQWLVSIKRALARH